MHIWHTLKLTVPPSKIWLKFILRIVLRGSQKLVWAPSKSIQVKSRYRRSIFWWEICPIFIFTTIFVHLHLGCLVFQSEHPIFRYTKMVVKITLRPISLQRSDRLYLNSTYIHFESDLYSVEHPVSTKNVLIILQIYPPKISLKFPLLMVLRGYLKLVWAPSKSICVKFRYRRSVFWRVITRMEILIRWHLDYWVIWCS